MLSKIRQATIELVLSTDLAKHSHIINCWNSQFENGPNLENESARLNMMQMIIKFSDVSNPAKEYEAHSKWSHLVIEEFYLQGDKER
jgi:cAMP-specific phosphodiesterase 4